MQPLLTTSDKENINITLKNAIKEFSYKENFDNPFLLTSGEYSPFYIDLKQILLNPKYLYMASQLILDKIIEVLNDTPIAIGGLTMGADPIIYATTLLAQTHNITMYPLIVRKEPKNHGSKKRIEGLMTPLLNSNKNNSIVLIDDVITTGMSTLKAFEAFKDSETNLPKYAFCLVDREQGGENKLLENGINIHSIYTIKDFGN